MAEKELKKEPKTLEINAAEHLQVSERLTVEKLRIYWEKNPAIFISSCVLTFGSPFIGLGLGGFWGFLVGIGIAIVSLWLSPKAMTKIIEKG
jgi:hypothetical protein